jgi:hypothetical protein
MKVFGNELMVSRGIRSRSVGKKGKKRGRQG